MRPLKTITFAELKDFNEQNRIHSFRRVGDSKLWIKMLGGWIRQPYLLEDVSFEDVGGHLAVSSGGERIFLKYPNFFIQHEGLIIATTVFMALAAIAGPPKPRSMPGSKATGSIQNRVQELTQIQSSLTTLSDYVSSQRSTLQETEMTLDALKREKGDVERALSIQRPQLEALVAALDRDSMKRRWIERAWSFVLGLGASFLASKALGLFGRRDKVAAT